MKKVFIILSIIYLAQLTNAQETISDDLVVEENITLSSEKYVKFGGSYSKIYEVSAGLVAVQGHNGIKLQSYYGPTQTLYTDIFARYGKVGIGTETPTTELTVNGDISITTERYIQFGQSYSKIFESSTDKLVVQGHNGIKFQSYNGSTQTLYTDIFTNYGKVGIGTESPNYELDVIGTIRSQEIKVDLDGADFVFEEDYDLRTLEEVESFVKENKHLPEIEPAAEMEEKGTDLGELNTKLLQKIEELTLYMIEQNKETKSIKTQLNSLTNENTELKEKIEILEARE